MCFLHSVVLFYDHLWSLSWNKRLVVKLTLRFHGRPSFCTVCRPLCKVNHPLSGTIMKLPFITFWKVYFCLLNQMWLLGWLYDYFLDLINAIASVELDLLSSLQGQPSFCKVGRALMKHGQTWSFLLWHFELYLC